MWCYQKPGFEALLLAELQRQQQCSQFCDTLLKTEGVSVPAHSCVLSAISPHISSTLSSATPPPAGQSRLLEFQALGACTLLHIVRLVYCGEMAGEGEREKQEAISAAAKLGIHGLVEVTKRDRKSRNEEGEGWQMEVGVQTESLMAEENEGRPGRWRREVTDGSTSLWKETLSDGKKDTWSQTEEQQVKTGPPFHSAASFETIDMVALQTLGQADTDPPQIPYIPISLVYPPDENQTHQPSSALVDSTQESTTAGYTSIVAPPYSFAPPPLLPLSSQATPCAADLQNWWAGPQGATRGDTAAEEWEDERLEQFQDNIPGYINYFLNPDQREGCSRGRARRRRGAGVGGARRAGTGERRARRPRARTGGRGRGGLMQTVDVQEVGVSRLQKFFLQRWGPSRTGQGGGAVGRRLYLKTRELLTSTKSCQRRRGRGKVREFCQSGDMMPCSEGGEGNTRRGRRRTTQQFNQDGLPVARAQKARAKPTTSVSFSSPHMQCYNVQPLPAIIPSLQPSPSPRLLSPAASYVPPASSLLHSTSHRPPAPPSHEEQPEHFDRLLEEVMMDLEILPNNNNNNNNGAPLAQDKQQGRTTGLLEASSGFHGSAQVAAVARRGGSCSSEMPVLQQQGEGELNEMLDHFLQSFEQHVDSCTAREEVEMGGQSCAEASQPDTALRKYRKTQTTKTRHTQLLQNTHTPRLARRSQITELQQSDEAESPPRLSQPHKASARNAAPPKHTEDSPGTVRAPAKKRKKRKKNQYLFTLEKKRVKVRKPASSSDAKTKTAHERRDKQLQQMPVVKLERSGPLPARVTLQERSCLEVKSPAITKTGASSVKYSRGSLSGKARPDSWSTKMYPIRSRFKEALIMDSIPFLEEPLQIKRPPSAGRAGRSRDRQLLRFSNGESSTPPIQPVELCGTDEQLDKNQDRDEEELTVEPHEEAEGATRRGVKRGAESEEYTAAKRVCFEQMAQPTSETCVPSSQSADFVFKPATREINDIFVETVFTAEDSLQRKSQEEIRETEGSLMDEEVESSSDEIIDVDADSEGDRRQSRTAPTPSLFLTPSVSPSSHSAKEGNLQSTGSWEEDEDIDVTGGSSPAPDPVIISWTESSGSEEEEADDDIDVEGEKTDYASSAVSATVSKDELNTKYQAEVLLHQHL